MDPEENMDKEDWADEDSSDRFTGIFLYTVLILINAPALISAPLSLFQK